MNKKCALSFSMHSITLGKGYSLLSYHPPIGKNCVTYMTQQEASKILKWWTIENRVYVIYYIYIILIARVRVQYGKIFYEHAKYFHEPKASENVA